MANIRDRKKATDKPLKTKDFDLYYSTSDIQCSYLFNGLKIILL